jgi:hypothetical protein
MVNGRSIRTPLQPYQVRGINFTLVRGVVTLHLRITLDGTYAEGAPYGWLRLERRM